MTGSAQTYAKSPSRLMRSQYFLTTANSRSLPHRRRSSGKSSPSRSLRSVALSFTNLVMNDDMRLITTSPGLSLSKGEIWDIPASFQPLGSIRMKGNVRGTGTVANNFVNSFGKVPFSARTRISDEFFDFANASNSVNGAISFSMKRHATWGAQFLLESSSRAARRTSNAIPKDVSL